MLLKLATVSTSVATLSSRLATTVAAASSNVAAMGDEQQDSDAGVVAGDALPHLDTLVLKVSHHFADGEEVIEYRDGLRLVPAPHSCRYACHDHTALDVDTNEFVPACTAS